MSDEPKWERKGECNGCGACCHALLFNIKLTVDSRAMHPPPLDPYWGIRGVTRRNDGKGGMVLQFVGDLLNPCPKYSFDQKNCTIYETRPKWCADFPTDPSQIQNTPCSYWFERGSEIVGGSGAPEEIKECYGGKAGARA